MRRYGGKLTAYIGDTKLVLDPSMARAVISGVAEQHIPIFLLLESPRRGGVEVRGYYVYRRGRSIVADRVPIEELVVMELYRQGRVRRPVRGRRYCEGSRCLSWRDIDPRDVEIYVNYLRGFA